MTTSGLSDFEKKLNKFIELFLRVTLEEMPVGKLLDDLCQKIIS